jgi:hypothetical protein
MVAGLATVAKFRQLERALNRPTQKLDALPPDWLYYVHTV